MRIALGIEYDGSGFCGWQTQQRGRTVQGCVEAALAKVANEPVRVVCAGRTDAGVHATGQVIHFDTNVSRSPRSWVLGTNVNLPADISVCWAQPVNDDFHARFQAHERRYRYVILNRMTRPALLRNRVCWIHQSLACELMSEAARPLLGEHDFSSFRAASCQAKHAVRTLINLEVQRSGDYVYIDVTANAFLYHMVRNLAGVLMAIGHGEQPASWAREVLEARDRTVGGVTAPAAGLYFVGVLYPQSFALPEQLYVPRFD